MQVDILCTGSSDGKPVKSDFLVPTLQQGIGPRLRPVGVDLCLKDSKLGRKEEKTREET